MKVDFFFSKSRGDIRPELKKALDDCKKLKIITGFVTESGLNEFGDRKKFVQKLDLFVFGHCNRKALEAMSRLQEDLANIGKVEVIKVHFGYGHKPSEEYRIQQIYRPMMHSKVFLFEYEDNHFTAFVGSQNITGYSLNGLNSEAIVKIEGFVTEDIYSKLLQEIFSVQAEADPFKKEFIDIYEEWHLDVVKGLVPEEPKGRREYLSVLYALIDRNELRRPKVGEQLYFEIPREFLGGFNKIENPADVWLIPVDLADFTWRASNSEVMFFRAIQKGVQDTSRQAVEYGVIEWHIANYKEPLIKRLDAEPKYNGGDIQVNMEFLSGFDDTYPNFELRDISYISQTRKENLLTPIFADSEDEILNYNADRLGKLKKDQESLFVDEWRLIKRFEQMEESKRLGVLSNKLSTLPRPVDLPQHLDILKDGVFYRPKVRILGPNE